MKKEIILKSRAFNQEWKARKDLLNIANSLPETPEGIEIKLTTKINALEDYFPTIEKANRDDVINVGLYEGIGYFIFGYAPNGYKAIDTLTLEGEEQTINKYLDSLDL